MHQTKQCFLLTSPSKGTLVPSHAKRGEQKTLFCLMHDFLRKNKEKQRQTLQQKQEHETYKKENKPKNT
jgi:hypothetical protein